MKHFHLACIIALLFCTQPSFSVERLLVYAAGSTSNAVTEIINLYNHQNPAIQVKVSFASSSTLAKQIEAGAPAQIYISANPKWMDYLQQRELIKNESRADILRNKLVLITPKDRSFEVDINKKYGLAEKLNGKLCLGAPNHVPVGIYAKQTLTSLDWWDILKPSVVSTNDVRAALTLVETGECAAGIVYFTDANSSTKIDLITEFPANSHDPIVYPVAALASAPDSAHTFINYLQSAQAKNIFEKYGFITTQ